MQTLLLLVSPALFAASIYMILGRIIALVEGGKHSLVRLTWLTKIFVAGDIFSFTLQAGGTFLQYCDRVTLSCILKILTHLPFRWWNDGRRLRQVHEKR